MRINVLEFKSAASKRELPWRSSLLHMIYSVYVASWATNELSGLGLLYGKAKSI
jgi:hypothetical protein